MTTIIVNGRKSFKWIKARNNWRVKMCHTAKSLLTSHKLCCLFHPFSAWKHRGINFVPNLYPGIRIIIPTSIPRFLKSYYSCYFTPCISSCNFTTQAFFAILRLPTIICSIKQLNTRSYDYLSQSPLFPSNIRIPSSQALYFGGKRGTGMPFQVSQVLDYPLCAWKEGGRVALQHLSLNYYRTIHSLISIGARARIGSTRT